MDWREVVQPLGDRVLVEVIEMEEQTVGGIYLPDTSKGRPERARVLAVGPGRYSEKTREYIPMPVEVGDQVVFHRHAGTHVGEFDDTLIIFREQDLLAKIEE